MVGYSQDWRVWLEKDGEPISFWHDIPLYPDESNRNIINFYVEIPRWTDGKVETKRNEPLSEPLSSLSSPLHAGDDQNFLLFRGAD